MADSEDPATASPDELIATGPGPRWLRRALVGLACVYFAALIHHPPDTAWLRPAAFFTEATCLFPRKSAFAIEYRLEVWACGRRWESIDPRPYFPIQPDDKESRLQRLGFFYERSRAAMQALDAYISAGHAAGAVDGVSGPIGGIRLVKIVRPFPAPGEPVERYRFAPLAPIPSAQRRDLYNTPSGERARRCPAS
ncbi:MAG TPA: hypothetical protein VFP84_22700 [Kofleriaceae bacterium]|nr:hypothetical protein [Kofleriaceae bacterium]